MKPRPGPDPFYEASPTKRQPSKKTFRRNALSGRSTKAEIEARRGALRVIVAAMHPMTVRQVFYQATVRGVVEKTEAGYTKVQTDLVKMRRAGSLSYHWITDNTRWQRKPQTFNSAEDALRETARLYRKSLWTDADAYVEVWLEKDALSGVTYPITSQFDVPLMVARGYASLSFLHSSAEYINGLNRPVYLYHLGDFDPSGVNAGEKIEETLRELAPKAEIHFERLAVTPRQISDWNLPTRPTKQTDARAKSFGDISVELDAIEPGRLRQLVSDAIELHLPKHQLEIAKVAEASERQGLMDLVSLAAFMRKSNEKSASRGNGADNGSPPYKEALKFIADFKGEPGDLLDWWRSLSSARSKMTFEEVGHLGKLYNAKFNELNK